MLLAGKKVVVVGGSSGIGLATAEMAKREGADVIIASRNVERLDKAAEKLNAIAIPADVTSDDSVAELFKPLRPRRSCRGHGGPASHRPVQDGRDGRRPRHHGRQVLGRMAGGATGADPRRRIADAGLGFPERSSAAEFGDRQRRQRRAGIAGPGARARTGAGARQCRLARRHRYADPRRDAGSGAARHAGEDRGCVAGRPRRRWARISRGRSWASWRTVLRRDRSSISTAARW